LSIGTNSVFLDAQSKTMLDAGDPKILLAQSKQDKVRQFLTRAENKNQSVEESLS
jgi:phospholipid/cholesterol/gamma-HCH transport system ATP-binding protein